MARRPRAKDSEYLRRELLKTVFHFKTTLQTGSLREKAKGLIPAHHSLDDLGCSLVPEPKSARERILEYLKKHCGVLVAGEELMVVAGISEYARRVRELRGQEGFSVVTGKTFLAMVEYGEAAFSDVVGAERSALKVDSYILLKEDPDREAAHRWHTANRIRKSKRAVKDKILEYLRLNVGSMVSGEELQYLAPSRTEWARRARELRTEDGWPVVTRNSGRPDLPVGFYLLEEDRQAQPHDRAISDPVRVKVLERDGHACRSCGWSYGRRTPGDPRQMLELHHMEHHRDGGSNEVGNLITLCNSCHKEVHRGVISRSDLEDLLR